MSTYTDPACVAAKIDWEGGIFDAINNYGLSSDDVKDAVPPEVLEAWKVIESVRPAAVVIATWMDSIEEEL